MNVPELLQRTSGISESLLNEVLRVGATFDKQPPTTASTDPAPLPAP